MAQVRIELSMPPVWERIDTVREAVMRCLGAIYPDGDGLGEALAMVSAELLENAVKYGKPSNTEIQFRLAGDSDGLEVIVTNQAGDDPGHVGKLLERVHWLARFSNAADAYLAALAELYRAPEANALGGGLGIVRVAHEGGCGVVVDLSKPGVITVRASRAVAGGLHGPGRE
jgi:hypothetical protein